MPGLIFMGRAVFCNLGDLGWVVFWNWTTWAELFWANFFYGPSCPGPTCLWAKLSWTQWDHSSFVETVTVWNCKSSETVKIQVTAPLINFWIIFSALKKKKSFTPNHSPLDVLSPRLIVLELNDASTLVGHFVHPREREKGKVEKMKERDRSSKFVCASPPAQICFALNPLVISTQTH